jgi:acyl transferase domain-containing protein
VTISGNLDSVKKAMEDIETHNPEVLVRQLKVDTAYHCSHMKDVGGRYKSVLDGHLQAAVSPIPFESSVSVKLLESEMLDSEYWQRNLESPVQFRQAVETILDDFKQPLFFLEVGPHSVLSGPLRQILNQRSLEYPCGAYLVRSKPCSVSFLSLVGQLYAQKQSLRWDMLTDRNGSTKVLADVPTYSWDHSMSKLYEPRSIRAWKHSSFPRHELLGTRVTYSTDDQPCWRNVLFFKHVPWIYEHSVLGNAVFPAAGYVAMAIEAVRQLADASEGGFEIRNLQMSIAMMLDRYSTTEIITSLRRRNVSWYDFTISSHNGVSWIEHCAGSVRCGSCLTANRDGDDKDNLSRSISTAERYQSLAKKGVDYGGSFQGIRSLRSSTSQCYASSEVVPTVQETVFYPIHPKKLDACFQTVYAAAYQGLEWKIGQLPVPTRIGEINIINCAPHLTCTASAQPLRKGAIGSHLEAYTLDGTMVLIVDDTVSQPLGIQDSLDNTSMSGARLHWARAVDFLPLNNLVSLPSDWRENARILGELTKACIEETLPRLENHNVSTTILHLQKYRG